MPKKYRNPYRKGTPQNPYKSQIAKAKPNYAAKLDVVQQNIQAVKSSGYSFSEKQIREINNALFTKSGKKRQTFTKEQKRVIDKYSRLSGARRSGSRKISIDTFYGQNDSLEIRDAGTLEISQRYGESEYQAKMRHAVEVLNRKKDTINSGGVTTTGTTLSAIMAGLQIANPGVFKVGRADDITTYDLSNYKAMDFNKPQNQNLIDKLVGLTSMSEVGQKAQRLKQARKYSETSGLSDISSDFLDRFLGSSLYMARNFAPEKYKSDSMQNMKDEMKMITGSENTAAKNKVFGILKSYDNAVKRAKDKNAVTDRYMNRLEKAIEEIRNEG